MPRQPSSARILWFAGSAGDFISSILGLVEPLRYSLPTRVFGYDGGCAFLCGPYGADTAAHGSIAPRGGANPRYRLAGRLKQEGSQSHVQDPSVAQELPERLPLVCKIGDAVSGRFLGAVVPGAEHVVPERAIAEVGVAMFLVDRMMQLVNERTAENPAPDPAPVPRQLGVLAKIDEVAGDDRDEQNAVGDLENDHRREEFEGAQERFQRMKAIRGDEIQFGRGMMKPMHLPEQRRVIEAMDPVAEQPGRDPVHHERERDLDDAVGRKRNARPAQLVRCVIRQP